MDFIEKLDAILLYEEVGAAAVTPEYMTAGSRKTTKDIRTDQLRELSTDLNEIWASVWQNMPAPKGLDEKIKSYRDAFEEALKQFMDKYGHKTRIRHTIQTLIQKAREGMEKNIEQEEKDFDEGAGAWEGY